ncbi:hypothetical protein EDC01DRAFT_700178 [Geopyxis carbonaria]|nr:hypothetical protein EDC01DRAFT_700178 [Geopyxis carbonaria]
MRDCGGCRRSMTTRAAADLGAQAQASLCCTTSTTSTTTSTVDTSSTTDDTTDDTALDTNSPPQSQHHHQHQQPQHSTQHCSPRIDPDPGATPIIAAVPSPAVSSRKYTYRTPRELAKKLFEQSIFSSSPATTTTPPTTTTTTKHAPPSQHAPPPPSQHAPPPRRSRFSMPMPNPNAAATVESRVMGRGNSGIPSHAATTSRNSNAPQPAPASRPTLGRQRASTVGSALRLSTCEKPQASTSGGAISMTIQLAEPTLFLQGFEQGVQSDRPPAMLRGSFVLKVTKPAKIKTVTLTFRGRARTEWPEGIPPKKSEYHEEKELMQHTWPFFNAQFPTAEIGHCADDFTPRRRPTLTADNENHSRSIGSAISHLARSASPIGITPAAPSTVSEHRLSLGTLPLSQSRSFGRGETLGGQSVAQRGYRVFQPGDYAYNFELPLEGFMPETIDADLGSVKYELEGLIERPGAFRPNLTGKKEVVLIRVPSDGNTEASEPIAISRTWEDQLHYDIVISGKSFPLGSTIPIAFKLTPLAKVRCHRIKIFITENTEYSCKNKKVHRHDPTKKIQLFEKRADMPAVSTFPGSSLRILAGGGYSQEELAVGAGAEDATDRAGGGGGGGDNLLGDLHGNPTVGPTEMEVNVKLPGCTAKEKDRLHFDTTYQNIQVHHWIKIVMRLSKQDPNDPSKRRHFEISIDSPFHILSCLATNANTTLPLYTNPSTPAPAPSRTGCLCPPLQRRNSPGKDQGVTVRTGPVAAPVAVPRPLQLFRAPSIGPPPFDAAPLQTPPPKYESVVGEHGLADYFSRLADAMQEDEEGEEERRGGHRRLMLPLTPGGRAARSMDERRTWEPIAQV